MGKRKRSKFNGWRGWLDTRPKPAAPERIVERDGRVNIERIGLPSSWTDIYHFLLTITWPQFIALITLGYGGMNAFFALLYRLQPNAIANADSFWDAFFFSVQTIGTIGYGVMSPQTFYANVLVTIETLVGLLGLTIATGLMFARFSRPTARVLFSAVAVVTTYNGVPTLMFRMANQRRNQILEAQVRVSLLLDEISQEGHLMRRFYDLPLIRSQSQFFTLSWTAMHPITETSPLSGHTLDSLREGTAILLVSLVGIDETFGQTVHARHAYIPEEILWDRHFVDVFLQDEAGQRYLDYRRFHQVTAPDAREHPSTKGPLNC
uniref:K channel inward rectifier conserved region 2 domain protein n=1 Tax=Cyanothece sp. (strain PCC 7425 / ATCC 29141) TaxID=395961 RepID=B8HUK5_CYAP4